MLEEVEEAIGKIKNKIFLKLKGVRMDFLTKRPRRLRKKSGHKGYDIRDILSVSGFYLPYFYSGR